MANNTESSHRRSTSAVSSVDEADSNDGTLSGPASTVPTAKSTPFIGPQNHPGIPAQHHPNPVTGLTLDNGDILEISLLDDIPFASQLDEVEGQIRMLGWNGPYPPDRNSRYRANLREPIGPDGIDYNELRAIEADVMFAEYYHQYNPGDGPFPPSNTVEAIAASMHDHRNDNFQWGPRQYCHVPDVESDTEENNEAIMATYETPLMPRYYGSPSYSDFLAASIAMPARPGTVAGMAIRDPTQPAQAPPIIRAEPRFSAETMAEMTDHANASATSPSPADTANGFDSSLAAVVNTFETRPAPVSTAVLSQELGDDSSPSDTDAAVASPVFPANWVTYTRTSMIPSLQLPPTPHRRHSRRHTINYTLSPVSDRHIEEN